MRIARPIAALAAGIALALAPLTAAHADPVTPQPITVSASATPATPVSGETIELTANATGGIGGLLFQWTGPDGFTATGATVTVQDATPSDSGTYTVTVSDGDASTANASAEVTVGVNADPIPTKTIVIVPENGTVGKPVTLSASVVTTPPGRAEIQGVVQFTAVDGPDGPWPLGVGTIVKGKAQYTFTPKSAGTYTIIATYPGTDDTRSSASPRRDMVVAPAVAQDPVAVGDAPAGSTTDAAQPSNARELAATGSAVMLSMGIGGVVLMSGLVLLLVAARRRIRRS